MKITGVIAETVKNELAKTQGMSGKARLEHFVRCYWLWAAGLAGGAALILYILFHAFFTVKEYWFYLTLVNAPVLEGVSDTLREDFAEYAGYDLTEKNVMINDACYFDASIKGGTNNNYFQAFVAAAEGGDLDAAVMSAENLKAVGSAGRLLDLSAKEHAELFARYADRFVYCEPYDKEYSQDPVPVGIDIRGSSLAESYLYGDDCVLGVSAWSTHPEQVVRFLEYIGVPESEEP